MIRQERCFLTHDEAVCRQQDQADGDRARTKRRTHLRVLKVTSEVGSGAGVDFSWLNFRIRERFRTPPSLWLPSCRPAFENVHEKRHRADFGESPLLEVEPPFMPDACPLFEARLSHLRIYFSDRPQLRNMFSAPVFTDHL
jgi:hypothetical protein